VIGNKYFNNIQQRYSATVRFGNGMAEQGSLCMQLSPLYHLDKGIEEGSRNNYFCTKKVALT